MPPASIVYVGFVLLAVLAAVAERARARRNETRLLREGADEIAPWVYRLMVPVYSLVFPAAVAEHVAAGRRPPPALMASMILLFAAAKALKAWAVRSLGDRWTMRVLIPSRIQVETGGPYRYIRHPNYVAVMIEVPALPLAGGAWVTAVVAGLLFGLLLLARVRSEEAALLARPEYTGAMGGKRRFLPGGGR